MSNKKSPSKTVPDIPLKVIKRTFFTTVDRSWIGFLITSFIFHLSFAIYAKSHSVIEKKEIYNPEIHRIAEFLPPEDLLKSFEQIETPPEIKEPKESWEIEKEKESPKEEVKEKETKKIEEPKKVEKSKDKQVSKITPPKSKIESKVDIVSDIEAKGILGVIGAAKSKSGIVKDILKTDKNDSIDKTKGNDVLQLIDGFKVAKKGDDLSKLKRTQGLNKVGETIGLDRLKERKGKSEGDNEDRLTEKKDINLTEKDKKKVARVETSAGNVKVTGQLEKGSIKQVVDSNITGIKYCYERELKNNPNIGGKIVVRFIIGIDGRVKSLEIVESTISGSKVPECIINKIRSWKFPPPKDGEVTVVYPFVFTAIT